jgi:hypothetical protein
MAARISRRPLLIGVADETDCPTCVANIGREAVKVTGAEH